MYGTDNADTIQTPLKGQIPLCHTAPPLVDNLKVGDDVWFALANDLTGIILERADGEWSGTIPGDVTTTGKLTSTDLTTSSVASINSHVHSNGNNGSNTGTPTG